MKDLKKKIDKYFDNLSKEDFEKAWEEVKAARTGNGLSVEEFLKTQKTNRK